MKPKSTLRSFLLLASSTLLAISCSQATTLYWDVNDTAAGFSTVVGTWGTNVWNDTASGTGGTTTAVTTNADDLNIVPATTNTGTITVTGAQVAKSITYGTGVGAVTISGGTSLTLGNGVGSGITLSSGLAGNQTITTPITLASAQTWTNSSSNALTLNSTTGMNNGGFTLTVDGTGNTAFSGVAGNVISGAGGITKNGTGALDLSGSGTPQTHTYSGTTTINNGVVQINGGTYNNSTGTGNLTLNGGVLSGYFGGSFTRGLGAGAGQIQILGGASGFAGNGATSTTFNIGGAAATLVWGSAFFNPSPLVLQHGFALINVDGKMTLSNGIDLAGTNRTIASNQTTNGVATSGATIAGVISNSSGTAGFEKTGPGNLILSNTANTYNGTTTISGGWITAAGSGSLGSGVASNTLIFNGGILRATGTITSPAARGVTLTSTGIIDNNGQAVSIAGDIGGAGGLTKNSTGTLTLSGTNSYGGVTIANAGTLAIAKEASLYNGNSLSWTAANINVKSGATFAVNVDSAGTAGFTSADLTTLLGNILVANTAAQGLQGGATLGIDTSTATGATFTLGSAITDSTGAFGGVINLNKLGAGTLVLNQANTYTGNTIISGGTIQYDTGAAIPTTPITNNAAFTFNATGALTQGTNFGLISGTGTVTQSGASTLTLNLANTYTGATTATAGTIILSNALALQNSALNTTGAGFVTLSGVTTPTFGGLSNSGTTRDLATVISSGYGSVTNLTLNPQSGSVTYDGVIANGAAGMSLTKTGAGTQVLTGIQTYTGATILSGGTLTLSGTGSILPSAITLNGGGLTLTNTAAETGSGRVNDTTGITSYGGTLTYNNTSGANVYAETVGSVALTRGQLNLVQAVDQVGAGSQTLTLGGLTHTGATNTSAITFSALGAGLNATKNMILVTGATPAPTPAGNIIAPWATIGTAAATQNNYAAYDASGFIVAAAPTAAAVDTDLASSSTTYSLNTGATFTLAATRTINALQFFGAASSLALGANNLETYGLLFSGANAKTVDGTGSLTTPAGGGNLYVTTGQASHAINAKIADNGGNVNLVKSGSNTLRLTAVNTYTGDTAINSGTLAIGAAVNGDTSTGSLNSGNYSGNIFIAGGANLAVRTTANQTLAGVISGDGNLIKAYGGTLTLSGNNTYTGKTSITPLNTTASGALIVSSFNSVVGGSPSSSLGAPTTVANGTIDFGSGAAQASVQINYTGGGEITDRVINFAFNGNGAARTIDASGSGLLKFTSNFTSNGTTTNNVVLQGTSNGEIVGGLPFTFTNFTKSGAGTWTLGGPLRNIGTTTANGGTLVLSGPVSTVGLTTASGGSILTLSGNNISMAGGVTVTASRLNIGNANALGTGAFAIGGTAPSIDNTSGSALTIATNNAQTWNGDFTFAGTNNLNLGTGAVALGGTRNVTVTANTLTVGGVISGVSPRGIQKSGAGTLVLTGANTYGGNTTVSGGTLAMGANDVLPDTTNVTIANGTLNAATFDDTAGTLAVTNAASTINLGAGANLVFADSSGVAWTGTLNITGTFVSSSSLKFGTSNTALTSAQLLAITATGWTNFGLDTNGYLTADSVGGPGPLDHFAISAISSPQTVGTPITGITLTAQDAANATVTSFTGTVSFGGTGGFTGTSGSFSAGVLNSVSVTPTVAGGGLTFTVTDGVSGKTGTTTITTIQTLYAAWSGGAAFDADANGDGVKNGLAWVFGAANPSANAIALQPTFDNTDPTYFIYTYRRKDDANTDPNTTIAVQYGANLSGWTTAVHDGTNIIITPTDNFYGASPGVDKVEVKIKKTLAVGGKLFTRLNVVQAP